MSFSKLISSGGRELLETQMDNKLYENMRLSGPEEISYQYQEEESLEKGGINNHKDEMNSDDSYMMAFNIDKRAHFDGFFRHHITKRFCVHDGERFLILGTSNFTIALCSSLSLSITTLLQSLLYTHIFFDNFSFHGIERKFVAASAVLLAWKYSEDFFQSSTASAISESGTCLGNMSKCNKRLIRVARSVFRLLHASGKKISWGDQLNLTSGYHIQKKNDDNMDTSSSWIFANNGRSFKRLCQRFRVYESALLRSIRFHLPPSRTHFSLMRPAIRMFIWGCNFVARMSVELSTNSSTLDANNQNVTNIVVENGENIQKEKPCICTSWLDRGPIFLAGMVEHFENVAVKLLVALHKTPFVLEYPVKDAVAAIILLASFHVTQNINQDGTDNFMEERNRLDQSIYSRKKQLVPSCYAKLSLISVKCIMRDLIKFENHITNFLRQYYSTCQITFSEKECDSNFQDNEGKSRLNEGTNCYDVSNPFSSDKKSEQSKRIHSIRQIMAELRRSQDFAFLMKHLQPRF